MQKNAALFIEDDFSSRLSTAHNRQITKCLKTHFVSLPERWDEILIRALDIL